MPGSHRPLRALFAAALVVLLGAFVPVRDAAAASAQKFGKTLLREHQIPADKIVKFNRFKASAPVKGESTIVNAMLADTEDWAGPNLDVRTAESPYTIVVLVTGTARAAGDATSLWQAGWRYEAKQGGDEARMVPLPGLAKTGAKAGETLELVAAATPTTFREDRKVSPVIGLVNARNLEITSVRVQIWSGTASTSFVDVLLSFRWALVGVVLIVLWWFWFRRT